MTTRACGCSKETCGCCEGTRKLTPASTLNRAGLDTLLYRVGTHGAFFETMKARLATMKVEAPGSDYQTLEEFYPLSRLTTRDPRDPAIALLDSWATVGDVLTFYQERIANEGYLRTATERRSVLELARLVGYKLRPGVASTVYLAYTLDDSQVTPVEIPEGARSQSVPGPGELPQSFETSEPLMARREWNNLHVRLTQPQVITLETAMVIDKIYVVGINTNLKTGDLLLLVFEAQQPATFIPSVARRVKEVVTQFEDNRSEIRLEPVPANVLTALPALLELLANIKIRISTNPNAVTQRVLKKTENLLTGLHLGLAPPPPTWPQEILFSEFSGSNTGLLSEGVVEPPVTDAIGRFVKRLEFLLDPAKVNPPVKVKVTNPNEFVPLLLKPQIPQAANSLQFGRTLKKAFAPGTDTHPQLLVNFSHELKDTFYEAWASADVNDSQPALKSLFALRLEASLFGANVSDQPTYYLKDEPPNSDNLTHVKGEIKTPDLWTKWPVAGDERDNMLFLDQAHDDVLATGYVMVQKPVDATTVREVHKIVDAQPLQRNAYSSSGKTTRITLATDWWKTKDEPDISRTLRKTLVFGQSDELVLADAPIVDKVGVTKETMSAGIVLDGLYSELRSGRWIILSGERADIDNVTGIKASELLMISGLRQDDPVLPDDKIHTTLLLATPTAYSYVRKSLTIYGNVVKATHGETTNEPLGNGDGSQALQSFELKQPPLTFVPSPNPEGVASTLKVTVNGVEWHETDSLAGLGPKDRNFITKTDDADKTTVIFGNGKEGSRLPTGVLNVNSVYRKGIGKGGNVLAEQISMLMTKPLGVKSVLNPLGASGGADKEDRDQARENAPLAVMALDRLVSFRDYADFTRIFAGIAKASGRRLSDRSRELVQITVAGIDDIPIEPVSDLYRNLVIALQELGDLSVAIQVDSRELVILVLSANIRLLPDYQWEPVVTDIRATLLDTFGFKKRALGQPALLCEMIGCIQAVEGVAYVDVDAFGGIPEKVTVDGVRQMQSLSALTTAAQRIADPASVPGNTTTGPSSSVPALLAGFDADVFHAAQLAIFTSAVQDTIVLNQIK